MQSCNALLYCACVTFLYCGCHSTRQPSRAWEPTPVVTDLDFSTWRYPGSEEPVQRLNQLARTPAYEAFAAKVVKISSQTGDFISVLTDQHFAWYAVTLTRGYNGWILVKFKIDRRAEKPFQYHESGITEAHVERILSHVDGELWKTMTGYTAKENTSLESWYSFIKVRRKGITRTHCVQNLGMDSLTDLMSLLENASEIPLD